MVEGTKVNILIENIHTLTQRNCCTVFEICKIINSNNLKVCLDICHLHCMANLFKENFDLFLDKYIDKELAYKNVYQIHFSATKNNDGYIEKKTHGVKHDTIEELIGDYNVLKKFNLTDRIIVTEIAEENYMDRNDQKFEIGLLEKIN